MCALAIWKRIFFVQYFHPLVLRVFFFRWLLHFILEIDMVMMTKKNTNCAVLNGIEIRGDPKISYTCLCIIHKGWRARSLVPCACVWPTEYKAF